MSTPEPPRGEQPERARGSCRPEPAGRPSNRPCSNPVADGQPRPRPDQSGRARAGPGLSRPGLSRQAESPAEAAPPGPHSGVRHTPPAAAAGGRKWYRPRRTWPWITGGVVGGVVALLLVFRRRCAGRFAPTAAAGTRGRHHGGEARPGCTAWRPRAAVFGGHGRTAGPGWTRWLRWSGGPGRSRWLRRSGGPGALPVVPVVPVGWGPGGFRPRRVRRRLRRRAPARRWGAGARMGGGSAVVGSLGHHQRQQPGAHPGRRARRSPLTTTPADPGGRPAARHAPPTSRPVTGSRSARDKQPPGAQACW